MFTFPGDFIKKVAALNHSPQSKDIKFAIKLQMPLNATEKMTNKYHSPLKLNNEGL